MGRVRRWIASLCLACSTYSRLPVPKVEWTQENQQYLMGMFPAVGVLEGACVLGAFRLMEALGLPVPALTAVLTALPLWVTGGIHMDGYLDTLDALGSWRGREERLRILKDSHVGAAAVTGCGIYLLLYAGGVGSLLKTAEGIGPFLTVALGFPMSRSLSGYGVLTIEGARADGMAYSMASGARMGGSLWALRLFFLASGAMMCWAGGWMGACAWVTAIAVFLWFRRMARRVFGGITGDLAGFFLQVCELAMLYGVVAFQAIVGN